MWVVNEKELAIQHTFRNSLSNVIFRQAQILLFFFKSKQKTWPADS
jgi:hypothetical protein